MMKTTFVKLAAALLALSALSLPAFAAQMTAQDAEDAAAKLAPEGSLRLKTEFDDGLYEIEFYSESRQETYEIKVDPAARRVVKFDSELMDDRGGRSFTLSEEAAKKAVTGELADAEILSVLKSYDDGLALYKLAFRTDGWHGTYKVHSETGKVLERELKAAAPSSGDIGLDRARSIAQAQVPGAVLVKCKLDREDGRLVYEAELRRDGWEYELEIDASTGAILKSEREFDD